MKQLGPSVAVGTPTISLHGPSIADERQRNPRLQVPVDEYVALMESIRPENPHLMDVVERPSLRPSASLMRELSQVRDALSFQSASGE